MADYGIDVSKFNTVSDWRAARGNGIEFMSQKLTQGSYYVDQSAAAHIIGARAAGLAVGGYHFGDPDQSIVDNVSGFVTLGRSLGVFADGSFLPMLDVEDSPPDGIHWTAASANSFIPAWITELRRHVGEPNLPVAIYASLSFWIEILRPDDWADPNVTLWLALYNGDPGNTGGWTHPNLALHQHTSDGLVPGVAGRVDRNVTVNGHSLADLTIGADMARTLTDDDLKAIWAFPLANPRYDQTVDPNDPKNAGDTRTHKSYEAGDYTANGDIFAQDGLAILRDIRDGKVVVATTTAVTLDPAAVAQALVALEGPQLVAAVTAALPQLPAELAHQLLAELRAVLDKAGA